MKNGKFCSGKKAMKPLAVLLAMILLVGCAVGGTLAWLTAQTEEVTNTFTSAVLFDNPEEDFTLWEHLAVDEDENDEKDGRYELTDEEVQANSYTILPGVNIPKDPTVDVENLKERAYLYIKVTGLPMAEGLTASVDSENWTALDGYEGVYVYSGANAENNVIKATKDDMKSFTATILTGNQIIVAPGYVPVEVSAGIAELTLSFEAYMVQATGNGNNAVEAWANTYGKVTTP